MTDRELPPGLPSVLFVGGTGMLAPAARWIAARSPRMHLAARHPEPLATAIGARPLVLDWHDRAAGPSRLQALIAEPPELLISWLHDDAIWIAAVLEALLPADGRSIRVHGARSADPEVLRSRDPDPRADLRRQTVILGWRPDPAGEGGRRWLTDDEISGGVIEAVLSPAASRIVVGEVAAP